MAAALGREFITTGVDRLSALRGLGRRGSPAPASLFCAVICISVSTACVSSAAAFDQAYTFRRLHSFCSKDNCPDGWQPGSALVMDTTGNLYGTTRGGGRGGGVVYKLEPDQQNEKFHVIYAFCEKVSCSTGATPTSNLIIDSSGNLYGTTAYGGGANDGTIFKLSPVVGRTKWKITKLYDFCQNGNGCPDGQEPVSGLTYAGAAAGQAYDGTSPLYGTTFLGGANNYGTVFEIKPRKQGKRWKERALYSFCSQANCADGKYPAADSTPTVDSAGKIYGTADDGGQ